MFFCHFSNINWLGKWLVQFAFPTETSNTAPTVSDDMLHSKIQSSEKKKKERKKVLIVLNFIAVFFYDFCLFIYSFNTAGNVLATKAGVVKVSVVCRRFHEQCIQTSRPRQH